MRYETATLLDWRQNTKKKKLMHGNNREMLCEFEISCKDTKEVKFKKRTF